MRTFKLADDRELKGGPFTFKDVNYPSNWLELAKQEDLDALGITFRDEADPVPVVPTPAVPQLLDMFLTALQAEAVITPAKATNLRNRLKI